MEQKSQCEVEVRQTDRHGTITARDNYELTRNIPKCVGVEHLCEGANMQIPFTADEINLIYQFGEKSKAETCVELTVITKRRKITERDHSIKARLAKGKEQSKQPTVAEGKQQRTHSKGKGDMAL